MGVQGEDFPAVSRTGEMWCLLASSFHTTWSGNCLVALHPAQLKTPCCVTPWQHKPGTQDHTNSCLYFHIPPYTESVKGGLRLNFIPCLYRQVASVVEELLEVNHHYLISSSWAPLLAAGYLWVEVKLKPGFLENFVSQRRSLLANRNLKLDCITAFKWLKKEHAAWRWH
jgi:hypothetical protein